MSLLRPAANPLAAENGTFGYRVRRPSAAVESVIDGRGGPSYKWVSDHRDRYSRGRAGGLGIFELVAAWSVRLVPLFACKQ